MANKPTTQVDVSTMNIFQKLAAIRSEFRAAGVQKSGKNIKQQYMFFELDDIIPAAEPILNKYHTMYLTTIDRRDSGDFAFGRLIDTDTPANSISFEFPMSHIISINPPMTVMNELQATGAEITYIRRYLYQIMLDITVADDIDSGANERTPSQTGKPINVTTKSTAAPTAANRSTIAKEITAADAPADAMQINAVKKFLAKLKDVAPKEEDFIQTIILTTNQLTSLTKAQAEGLVNKLAGMITEYSKGATNNGNEDNN